MLTASVLILFGVTYWFARDYAARDENNEIDVEYASILDEARTAGISKLPEIIDSHMRLRKDVRGVYLLEDFRRPEDHRKYSRDDPGSGSHHTGTSH